MSENINGSDMLSSGGHVWLWDDVGITRKSVGSVAIRGAYGQVTAVGVRAGRITGRDGSPALLTASGATKAAADTAMTTLEAALEDLIVFGDEVAWEDDHGHAGIALVLLKYARSGHRKYGRSGSDWVVWQNYNLTFEERTGGW